MRRMEEVNLLTPGCTLHSQPPSSVFLRYDSGSQTCALTVFIVSPWHLVPDSSRQASRVCSSWVRNRGERNIQTATEDVCVCLCVTVNTGTLCSFKTSRLHWFGRVREEEWEGAVSVGTLNGWEVCVCACVRVCVLMCFCFRVAQCMKGLTLWEFDCALMCSQLCCLPQLHTHILQHREYKTTHFAFTSSHLRALFIHSHIICLPVFLCCSLPPSLLHTHTQGFVLPVPRGVCGQCCCDTDRLQRDLKVEGAWQDVVWTHGGTAQGCRAEKVSGQRRKGFGLVGKSSSCLHSNGHTIMTTFHHTPCQSSPVCVCNAQSEYTASCVSGLFMLGAVSNRCSCVSVELKVR